MEVIFGETVILSQPDVEKLTSIEFCFEQETIVSEQKLNDASVTELDNVKNQHIEQTLVIKDIGVQVKSKSVMVEPEKPNKLEAPSSSSVSGSVDAWNIARQCFCCGSFYLLM